MPQRGRRTAPPLRERPLRHRDDLFPRRCPPPHGGRPPSPRAPFLTRGRRATACCTRSFTVRRANATPSSADMLLALHIPRDRRGDSDPGPPGLRPPSGPAQLTPLYGPISAHVRIVSPNGHWAPRGRGGAGNRGPAPRGRPSWGGSPWAPRPLGTWSPWRRAGAAGDPSEARPEQGLLEAKHAACSHPNASRFAVAAVGRAANQDFCAQGLGSEAAPAGAIASVSHCCEEPLRDVTDSAFSRVRLVSSCHPPRRVLSKKHGSHIGSFKMSARHLPSKKA